MDSSDKASAIGFICVALVFIAFFLAVSWLDSPPSPFEVCEEIKDDSPASKDCFDAIGRERAQ